MLLASLGAVSVFKRAVRTALASQGPRQWPPANGLTAEQVVEELPDLELEDVYACLKFVSRRIAHPLLVP